MFYNHTVLTSREHGVAVVWLIATLGSKTSSKKVTRKKILEVDVQKACDTIRSTEAPFALRLQGSLLYGVTRVYEQKCRYVLADVTAMRDKIRGVAAFLKDFGLDPQAGKAKPDQLNLPYDPTFMAQLDLDMDLSVFGTGSQSSRRSSLLPASSLLSSQSSVMGDEHAAEQRERELELVSDASLGGPVGGFDLAANYSGGYSSVGRGAGDPDLGDGDSHIQDPGWEIDEHDNMVETGGSTLPRLPRLSADPNPFGDAGAIIGLSSPRGGSASHRGSSVGGGLRPLPLPDLLDQLDDGLLNMKDDDHVLLDPPQSPQSPQDPAQASHDHARTSSEAEIIKEQSSSTSASAPQRRARAPRTITIDARTDLRVGALEEWRIWYLDNMNKATAAKVSSKASHQAKKNAAHWMLGQGIGGVGAESPLQMFCGDALLASLHPESPSVAGKKRARSQSPGSSSHGEGRRVRARGEAGAVDDGPVLREELGGLNEGVLVDDDSAPDLGLGDQDGGLVDDGIVNDGVDDAFDDMEIEVAREEVTEMPRSAASAHPWNIRSASRQPSSLHHGSVAGGPPSSVSRPASRITAASPLEGRGRGLPLSHRISILNTPEVTTGLEGDHGLNLGAGGGASSDNGEGFQLPAPDLADDEGDHDEGDYDYNSPGQKQRMATALDEDAKNFLDMLDDRIQEQPQPVEGISEAPGTRSVTFAELLPPAQYRIDTAAAAFLHVLCLASKNLISVQQDKEIFGDITLSITVGV